METSFKIELKGSFIQIMSFMDEIAHMKRIITTKSISFKDPVIKWIYLILYLITEFLYVTIS